MITGPNGFGIVVYDPCSSFHNVFLSRWWHQCRWGQDLAMPSIVVGTMILLNFFRLCLMASDQGLYDYWHSGAGADIFAIGASLTILSIALHGLQRTEKST
jgi:hypothetical protein